MAQIYIYIKYIFGSKGWNKLVTFAKNRHILKREQNNNNELTPQIEKLLIDNDSMNFPFHAAYLVYEEAFDKATEAQAKTELNQNIQDLKENKIDLETFYRNLG